MKDRISILRNAISTIAHSLAEQSVEVRQRGLNAYVELDKKTHKPKTINLPYIPDDASDNFICAIRSYLDTKVAGVLFSNHEQIHEFKESGNKDAILFFDVLEELRTEKKMFERYKGSASFNNQLSKIIVDEREIYFFEENVSNDIIGYNLPLIIKGLGGNFEFQEFIDCHKDMFGEVLSKLSPLKDEINSMESTLDAINLAKKMVDFVKSDEQKMDEKSQDDNSEDKNPNLEDHEDGDKTLEDGGESKEDDSSDGKNDENSSDDNDNGDESSDNDEDSNSQENMPSDSNGEKQSESSEFENKESSTFDYDEVMEAFGVSNDVSKELIDTSMKTLANEDDGYLVFTTDYDKVESVKIGNAKYAERTSEINRIVEKISLLDGYIGVMAKDIERALTAKDKVVWENGLRKGKINSTSLSRLITSNDNRIFRKKHEAQAKNVAVSIVVDYSGSMEHDQKMITAIRSACALAQVLNHLNIKFEILFFTTKHTKQFTETDAKLISKNELCFARVEPLLTLVAKSYSEKFNYQTKLKLAQVFKDTGKYARNNVDGESIEIAYKRLLAQDSNRKIMIVLSDGQPCAYGNDKKQQMHLKRVIKKIEESNISIVGIGIKTDAVKNYYANHVVVNEVRELQKGVMKELGNILLSK